MYLETNSVVSLEMLRGLGTLLAFVAFIAICVWTYSRNRREDFEQAANLPFADDANNISCNKQCIDTEISPDKYPRSCKETFSLKEKA